MEKIIDIPFRKIPHQSALFLRYLESSSDALRFYQHAPNFDSLKRAAQSAIQHPRFPRKEIAAVLRRQNEQYGSDTLTLDRIADLERPDSVAVVTGQQVGLFAGPLYTTFKAMTTIRIADELRKNGIRAVPIFWMETEDHDLAEVTRRTVLNPDSSLQSIDYREILFDSAKKGLNAPVGSIAFPESILMGVQDFLRRLPDGLGKQEVRSQIESATRPGTGFSQSFAELMVRIFQGEGLILFNPQDPAAKRLNSALFRKALVHDSEIRTALLRKNQELESSGFHSQVNILEGSTVLFFIENGERHALERRGSDFLWKNTDRVFSADELLDCAAHTPEKFSPNVLLRPLVQDHLFPTAAYVGGSSEVAYFAQIQTLYEFYGRPMPVIWPRNSHTLIEPEPAKEMDRLGISLEDCFQGKQALVERAVRAAGLSQASESLDSIREYLDAGLTEIKPELQALEPPLAQAVETARRKILHNVQHLRAQASRLEGSRDSALQRAIEFVLNHCYPNQNLQERELGIHYFLARYGTAVLDTIRSATDIGNFAHRVIHL